MFWFHDKGLCEDALDMIAGEDTRQRTKWGDQKHSDYNWFTILMEEVGELCKAALEGDLKAIVKEATQVATLALKIAWMARRKLED